MNKVDLASPAQLETLEGNIKKVNPGVNIYRTVRGQLDLKHILGIEAYSTRALGFSSSDASSTPATTDPHHCEDDQCDHDHAASAHHYEVRGISSLQVACPTLTEEGLHRLDAWIREILWEGKIPGDAPHEKIVVLRCKGMFHGWDHKVYVLQGVRNLYEIAPVEGDGEALGVPDVGKLVLIGKGLDDAVRKSLQSLLSDHRYGGIN